MGPAIKEPFDGVFVGELLKGFHVGRED